MSSVTPRVFVSATSGDLRAVRQTVRDALINLGCLPVVQDHFPPDYREVSDMLRGKIEECDALIHIAGMRYGAEPDPASLPPGSRRRSYTQMEYDLAREMKLEKVFTFICPEDFPYETNDTSGRPLREEPEELQELQRVHRERLLSQKNLRYRVDSPEEVDRMVREIQLELEQIKGQFRKNARRTLLVGIGIAAGLLLVSLGIVAILDGTGGIEKKQIALQEQIELGQQTERVLQAYQDRFREIRDDPTRDTRLPPEEIDGLVRAELPRLVSLDPARVEAILEAEAPRLAAEGGTELHLKLAALFAMGEYETALASGRSLLVDPTVSGLQTLGDAALARFQQAPEESLRADAIRYFRGSLALIEAPERPEEWAAAAMLLGEALFRNGDFAESETLFRKVLEIRESALGEDHPDTQVAINSLANALRAQGKAAEAEPLYRRALEASRAAFGENHRRTLTLINNHAAVLEFQGRYAEAEPLFREALRASEAAVGREHPETLTVINNLASALFSTGNLDEAESLYGEALTERRDTLGEKHPDTLTSVNNLAELLAARGKFDEAEPLFRESLASSREVHGEEHPDTLSAMHNLAGLLQRTNRDAEAEEIYRQVILLREKRLGEEHPDTLTSKNNLASLVFSQGNAVEAETLCRETLAAARRVLGPDHPDTLGMMGNLAGVLLATGKTSEAETLFRESLDGCERQFGRDHPYTLHAIHSLAEYFSSQGRFADAEPLYREALEGFVTVFGEDHPEVAAVRENRDRARAAQGR